MMNWLVNSSGFLASFVLMFAVNVSASAQQNTFQSAEDIVRKLEKPHTFQGTSSGTRGGLTRNAVPRSRSIDLTINFEFDSDRVVLESKPQLEALRDALQSSKLTQERFTIEGHTDAKGSASYNFELSQRRALAIVQFLKESGVSDERLSWEGKGFSELKDTKNPESAVNRRVRIKANE